MNRKLFRVKEVNNGWIIERRIGRKRRHTHYHTEEQCNELIDNYLVKNKLPSNKYKVESCRRLLTSKEFSKLKEPKGRYYNVNKGTRHK